MILYQYKIAVAYNKGDMALVKHLQHLLINSFAAKAVAVKTVTSNKGKKTAGVDVISQVTHTKNKSL